jgi:hypothetical protein
VKDRTVVRELELEQERLEEFMLSLPGKRQELQEALRRQEGITGAVARDWEILDVRPS